MRAPSRLLLISLLIGGLQLNASAAYCAKRGKHHLKSHHPGNYAIRQIQPGAAANGRLALNAADRWSGGSKWLRHHYSQKRHGSSSAADLANALSVPPNPQTTPILVELGIPVIDAIPPIAILNPGNDRRSESEFLAAVTGVR